MMKKWSLWLLTALLALCLFFLAPQAQAEEITDSGTCGENATWTIEIQKDEAGELIEGILTISGTGDMAKTSDADTPVTPEEHLWLSYRDSITKVVIEEGITGICGHAFISCFKLKEVSIPSTVDSIGNCAFAMCSSLTEITLPEGLQLIPTETFTHCASLTKITIPDSVTFIDIRAFAWCSNLTDVILGKNSIYIADFAFFNCNSLRSVTFRGEVPTIAESAFPGLQFTAHYPKNDTAWAEVILQDFGSQITWNPYDPLCDHVFEAGTAVEPTCTEDGYCLHHCSCGYFYQEKTADALTHSLTTQFVQATCTEDGFYSVACTVCGEVLSYSSYSAVRHIYENGHCVICGEETPDWFVAQGTCGSDLRWMLNREGVMTIWGTGRMHNYEIGYFTDTVPWAQYRGVITALVIEEGVTGIGTSAFENCAFLTSVSIPDTMDTIGERAFKKCTALTELSLGKGVATLGKEAFSGCKSLTAVDLPESLTAMQDLVFAHCENLMAIVIPDGIARLGKDAFRNCTNLIYVSFPDTMQGIDAGTFSQCKKLWHVLYRGEYAPIAGRPEGSYFFFGKATVHYQCSSGEITIDCTDSTCVTPGTFLFSCSLCNEAHYLSRPLAEHIWKEATCTEPRTCRLCAATDGEPLGGSHIWDEGTMIQEPTETQVGVRQHTCSVCRDTKVEMVAFVPQASPEPETPISGTALFLIIIAAVVVAIGGVALAIYIRQRSI